MNCRGGLIFLALLVRVIPSAYPNDSVLDRAEPEARKRFESLVSSYRDLKYYEDQGTLTRSVNLGDRPLDEKTPIFVKFSPPHLLVLQAGEIEIVGDGKTLKTMLHPTRRYLEENSPQRLRYNKISDGPAGAILFGGFGGPPTQLLLKMLLGEPVTAALPDRTSALRLEPGREWEGRTYDCLRLEQGDEPPLRVYIDPATNLIRRMEYVLESDKLSEKIPGGAILKAMSLSWDSGPIVTTPPEKVSFEQKTPEGYTKVQSAKPKVAAEAAINPLLGKPAPDFLLEVLDGPGKTRKVSRAELAGKIVILDFWATWCGPCLLELPEIQSLANELEQTKRSDVMIVAVSEDRKPEGGGSTRKLVEDLLQSRKLSLAEGPISSVALDPDQATGELIAVEALPTIVVIDSKGIIRAVHVAYQEGIKDILLDEIARLREGKPLK